MYIFCTWTLFKVKMKDTDPNWLKPRGVLQRNAGLNWLRQTAKTRRLEPAVVYFADDDNTYSLQLFEEVCVHACLPLHLLPSHVVTSVLEKYSTAHIYLGGGRDSMCSLSLFFSLSFSLPLFLSHSLPLSLSVFVYRFTYEHTSHFTV